MIKKLWLVYTHKMGIKSVSVVVPAYQQEKNIYSNLKEISSVLEKTHYPYELICVVDGQKADKTLEEALSFAKGKKPIKVLGYDENKGKGYAVRLGMSEARGEVVGFIDSGGDIKPSAIPTLIEYFQKYQADIVVGSKRHPHSKVSYSWQRKVISLVYFLLVRLLFNLQIRDTQAGIKFFRQQVLKKILPKLLVNRFAFDIEMLSVAQSLGFEKIYEAPIEVKLEFKGGSNITNQKFLKTIFQMIIDTLSTLYRLRISKYYSR